MQTNFTKKQLAKPAIAEANRILQRCIHCGLCTATCPTYLLLGDERDSPRGRIYLMKDMFEGGRRASAAVQLHIDRCLSCLSCMTTCPSGVDYMHLVDHGRAHIEATRGRAFKDRAMRRLLAWLVPYPRRFRWALRCAPLGRPLLPLMKRFGLKELAAMVELAPLSSKRPKYAGAGTAETKRRRRGRVILHAGCAQQALRPDINDAAIRLLARSGINVEVASGAGCCGAISHHMGRQREARRFVRRNLDAWLKVAGRRPVDAIVITASGCGTTVKDYGHMMARIPGYADKAKQVSALAKDISEFIYDFDLGPAKRWSSLRVAYHSACSLQHGQQLDEEPKILLRRAGFTLLEIPEGHICCGSAGTYNILQPELAGQLRARKLDNIARVRPDVIAAGNIGCMAQLAGGTHIPIVHTVELLDWAYGGPVPRGLEEFADFVSDVPGAERTPADFIDA